MDLTLVGSGLLEDLVESLARCVLGLGLLLLAMTVLAGVLLVRWVLRSEL